MSFLLLDDTIALVLLFENQLTQILISQPTVLKFHQLCSALINVFHFFSHFQNFAWFAKFSCENIKKNAVIFARVNVSSEEKILSISRRINHLVAEASLDVEDTKRAKYPAQEEYDETPLADSTGSSVVHTCNGESHFSPFEISPFFKPPPFSLKSKQVSLSTLNTGAFK